MFEKLTKKIAGRVTDTAADGMKKTFNDRIDQYGDIIQIGLVLGVIIIGGRHLTRKQRDPRESYIPYRLPEGGSPIVINNYYREREEQQRYEYCGKRNCYMRDGKVQQQCRPAQTANQKYQNRR